MAREPANRAWHALFSTPFGERQKARLVRESRKRKLSAAAFAKYSTLMRTSHSGVTKRRTLSVSLSDFHASAFVARAAPVNDTRRDRLVWLGKPGGESDLIMTLKPD
jgi:hypothetical protein